MKHSHRNPVCLALPALTGLLNAQSATTTGAGASTDSGYAWIAPLLGLVVGGTMIFLSIREGRKAKASLQWPSVPGTVVFSGMVRDKSASSDDTNPYDPVVTYSYVVNGQALQSSNVRFSGISSKKSLAKYPTGNPVQVFFDPQQPATAVLEKGGSTRVMLFVGVAVIAGSFVIGLAIG